MPLIKSASKEAVGENISREMDAGKPHKQAIAIALDVQRRAGKQSGGGLPWLARIGARQLAQHAGALHSTVPGRTDKLPITVGGGSYILPSDHVAAIGQGNSTAGAAILDRLFKQGPYGTSQTPLRAGMRPTMPHLGMRAPRMP